MDPEQVRKQTLINTLETHSPALSVVSSAKTVLSRYDKRVGMCLVVRLGLQYEALTCAMRGLVVVGERWVLVLVVKDWGLEVRVLGECCAAHSRCACADMGRVVESQRAILRRGE